MKALLLTLPLCAIAALPIMAQAPAAPVTSGSGASSGGGSSSYANCSGNGAPLDCTSFQAGTGTASGVTLWSGATSGGQAIGAAAVAGTPILYMMPSTAGTAGQVMQDTGAATCPSLPTGAPATCHQMAWAGGGGNFSLIQDQLLASPAASVTFSAIPGTFKHLKLYVTGISSWSTGGCTAGGDDSVITQANGDGGDNYSYQYLRGLGAATSAGQLTATNAAFVSILPCATSVAHVPGTAEVTFNSYSKTTFYKEAIGANTEIASTTLPFIAYDGIMWLWNNTAAITSLTLTLGSGSNFVAGSEFTLYGIN